MHKPTFSALVLIAGLAACAGAPAYRSSDVPVPPAFRETTVDTTRSPAERMPPRPAFDSTAPVGAASDSVGATRHPGATAPAGGRRRAGRPVGLLAHAGRHDARPTDRRGDPGQSRRAGRGRARAGRAGGAHRGRARLRADGHGRRGLHPPAALERDVPHRRGRRVPRPGHLGRRLRRVVGAGPVRPGAAERPGARRARRRGERGPARRAGVSRFRGGTHVLRAARGPGAARRGAPQRRQPAPHPRGDPAAAGCRPRHGIRHRAGADAARLHAGVHSRARGPGGFVPVPDRRAGRPAARQAGRRAGLRRRPCPCCRRA